MHGDTYFPAKKMFFPLFTIHSIKNSDSPKEPKPVRAVVVTANGGLHVVKNVNMKCD
ncbi:MAG: hypothetical protein HGB32_08825 [Geobacteraceae bacterium]|nr:hypothetical protein [Geobacteraceae bacterium]NTW80236.1 hypothetical protein [Geobacteraceae bacterium]